MANKKISELQSRTPALSDLMLVGDPSSGYSYKCTVTALATIIETDIADGYVTIGTTQTISGAKTFSNNLTLTSVVNTPTDPDKFLTLNASNVITYRTGAEVLSDIGGVGGSGTTNYLPKFSATTTLANSQIFDNGTNIGIATATPDATARVQINKTDGYGLYLNYNTSAGSGVTTTALYAINTTASSGYAAVIEEKTPNTTAGQYPFVIKHSLSSGTAGVGFGTGVHFQLLDDAGTSKTTQLTIENIDAAAATYKTRYRFNVQNNGSSTPVVYINATGLGVFTASPSVALDVTGEGKFSTINNATTDTDRFLVSDSGVLKYRTGAEVLSDIGGQGALTLTTSGSSGAATLVGNTLNIPNYGSALSGYVPYTGATTNVNLGTRYLQANYLVVDGQSNATGINFKQYSSVSFNGDGYTAMGPVSVDKMFFNFAQGSNIFKIFYFDVSGITGNATRAYTMPNSDGTLALTSQIPTVSGTTNYIPKFTSSSAIGNSDLLTDGSGNLAVAQGNAPTQALNIYRAGSTQTVMSAGNSNTGLNGTFFGVDANGNGIINTTGAFANIFSTNGSERMRLTSGGLLGLGTSSPSNKLTVQVSAGQDAINWNDGARNGYLYVDGAGVGVFSGAGATNQGIYLNNTSSYLAAFTSGSERMRLDASGRLGIGTSSPSQALDVLGMVNIARNQNSNVTNLNINSGSTPVSAFQISTDQPNLLAYLNSRNNYALGFYTNDVERMRLDASGNLGLGTSSPSAKLHIAAAAVSGTVDRAVIIANSSASGSGSGSEIYLGWNSPSINAGAGVTIGASYAGGGTNMLFSTPSSIPSAPNVKMTLDGSGNLGLGVTPAAWSGGQALQILNGSLYGSGNLIGYAANSYLANSAANDRYIVTGAAIKYLGNINGDHRWYVAPSGTAGDIISFTQAMTLDASGRLGIGTTSPNMKLVVTGSSAGAGDTGIVGITDGTGANTDTKINFGVVSGSYGWIQAVKPGTDVLKLALNPNGGNVGIGTSSPTNGQLVVKSSSYQYIAEPSDATTYGYLGIGQFTNGAFIGTTAGTNTVSDVLRLGTSGTERMRITSGGLVGIGTSAPSVNLQVQSASAPEMRITDGTIGYQMYAQTGSNDMVLGTYTNHNLLFRTNAQARMLLSAAGELLINTTSDAGDYKLQVNGNSYVNGQLNITNTGTATGKIYINGSQSSAREYLIENGITGVSNAGFQIRDITGSFTPFYIDASGNSVFYGSIKTAAPSGGNAAAWKLGERVASSSLTLNTTQYIQLDINGTLYTLATVNLS